MAYTVAYTSYRTGDAIRETTLLTRDEAEARKQYLITRGISAPNTVKIEAEQITICKHGCRDYCYACGVGNFPPDNS